MDIYLNKINKYGIILDRDIIQWIVDNKISVSVNGHGHPKYYCRSTKKNYLLSRKIMEFPKGKIVDHVNGNPRDNRRSNLQIISMRSNQLKAKIPINNSSGAKGVSWDNYKQRWVAIFYISIGNKIRKAFKNKRIAIQWRRKMESQDRKSNNYKNIMGRY